MPAELKEHRIQPNLISLGSPNGLELAIRPRAEKTLGKIISSPHSPDLIEGVLVEPLSIYPDDRGYFTELGRLGKGLASCMVPDSKRQIQISSALSFPGTIKAIHYHSEQTDLWAPVSGMLQVFLYDLRVQARTFGEINTLYLGIYRPWEILIPPGVGHGYKVLGNDPLQLVYLTDRHYNPADELRLKYNDPQVNYDWETQYK